jgi:ATP-dependent DNA ligase
LKYAGFRGVLDVDQGKSWFRSKTVMCRFEGLARLLACELQVESAILDGEIVALDDAGRPQFIDLMRKTRDRTPPR